MTGFISGLAAPISSLLLSDAVGEHDGVVARHVS